MAVFEDRITVARPVEVVFDFLITSANIEKVSAGELGLSFVEAPEKYHQGAVVKFRIMAMGQVRTAIHEVTEFEHPRRFVERQIDGALKTWVHEHLFEKEDGGGTHIIDRITFEPPGGLLGLLATEERIIEQLEEGFFARNRLVKQLLEQDGN